MFGVNENIMGRHGKASKVASCWYPSFHRNVETDDFTIIEWRMDGVEFLAQDRNDTLVVLRTLDLMI
jgi:hypothetical protein